MWFPPDRKSCTAPGVLCTGLQSEYPVTSHSGKDNADGLFLLVQRQLPEEEADRHPQAAGFGGFKYMEFSMQDGQVRVGMNHVNVIGMTPHPIFSLNDFHPGVPPKKLRHHAFVCRLEMGHQNKREAGVRGQMRKELLKCL